MSPASGNRVTPPAEIRSVAIIGAGPRGQHLSLLCLRAGLHVILEDLLPANLRRAESTLLTAHHPGQLDLATTVEDAVRSADLAIDLVPDELESKLEIFSMIDRMAPPRTLLCTPTETLSITDLASCVYRPQLCFALRGHSLEPDSHLPLPLLYPPAASPDALSALAAFFTRLGFHPMPQPDPDLPMLLKNLSLHPDP